MTVGDADILFDALSDATRRAAVAALITRPYRSGELAQALKVTPQALTRHLRVLRRAGIAKVEADDSDARLRVYRVDPAALGPLRRWIDDAERVWTEQLASFKAHAESGGQ